MFIKNKKAILVDLIKASSIYKKILKRFDFMKQSLSFYNIYVLREYIWFCTI